MSPSVPQATVKWYYERVGPGLIRVSLQLALKVNWFRFSTVNVCHSLSRDVRFRPSLCTFAQHLYGSCIARVRTCAID